MIDRRTRNTLLSKCRINDIVSDYMLLHSRGNDFVGYCPFHTGKMMTFNVNTSSGTYRCSECGKRGSAIDFLIDYLHISYDEALAMIAHRYGIDFKTKGARSNAATLYEINAEACNYYQDQLFNSTTGQNIALTY